MIRTLMIATVLAALSACAKKEEAAEAQAPAAIEPAPVDAAAQPIAGDPSSAWVELMGAWALPGACEDDQARWVIEAEAFHLYEMHCPVKGLELLANGVRAKSDCVVEGDDDGVEDVFAFVRREDATLSITIEANGAVTDGLMMCGDDLP